jgi:anion-transporting  ArsA/GET3 family ATPase
VGDGRSPLSHRLIFVTGKGGVGKSTVAAALALASARRGLRTLLAETSSQARLQRAFGRRGRLLEEVELSPLLSGVSIDPELAMQEYLEIRMGAVGRAIGSSKPFQAISMATPGMREMQTMAKIWQLAHPDRPGSGGPPYDVVVVDAPSTCQAIGLLRTPRTFASLARVGPVANGARKIAAMVDEPAFTGFVAVTTPQKAAVAEMLLLRDALAADGLSLSAVVLNRLDTGRVTAEGVEQAQPSRVGETVAAPLIKLPTLPDADLGRATFDALAETWP